MSLKFHKKTKKVVMFCDLCGKYACYSNGKNQYCGNCIEVEYTKKGIVFKVKANNKKNNL